MKSPTFDEILDRCLDALRTGASIDDCVAPYPEHAEELRAQLHIAQTLLNTRPQVSPDAAAQAQGRARLLTAVGAQRQASEVEPTLGLVAPLRALFGGMRWKLLPQALPAVLALLILGGAAWGVSAATGNPDPTAALRGLFESSGSDNAADEPRSEFRGAECDIRGRVSSLEPLTVDGIPVEPSPTDFEQRGDMEEGASVRVRGTFNANAVCVAEEIRVEEDEPRSEFRGAECDIRGRVSSLEPLTVDGIPVEPSPTDFEQRGDMEEGASVRVRGTFNANGVCIAEEIRVEEDEDHSGHGDGDDDDEDGEEDE